MSHGQISGKKAQKLVEQGAVLIDVRNPVAFRDGSLPGAVNLSLRQIPQVQKHPKTTTFVLFGESETDDTLKAAINYINLYGYTKVFSLGSIDNWNK